MKILSNPRFFFLLLFSLVLAFSCDEDDDPPVPVDNTPADVVGTLTLPFDVNGKSWHVVFDEDIDLSNGYIHTDTGICGTGTTVSISIEDVPEGVYFVYARVSVNSQFGSTPVPGDLIGIYGGTFPDNLPASPNFTIPEKGEVNISIDLLEVVDDSPADVVGVLNLPFDLNGKSWHIVFDEDIDLLNGYIYTDDGVCGSGTEVSFSLEDVPEGTYYVYARVSVNSQFGETPLYGDLIGIYGGTFPFDLPASASFTVPETGEISLAIDVVEYNSSFITPGYWVATSEFGNFEILINQDATYITEIKFIFDGWTCGGVTMGGGFTVSSSPGWQIENFGTFSISLDLDPGPFSSDPIDIEGTLYHITAIGSWDAEVNGSNCSGMWTAAPKET